MSTIDVAQTRVTGRQVTLWSALTEREHQVLDGIVAGLSNPEMATELFVSVNTIKFHVANLLQKLSVRSRTDAAVIAVVDSRRRREERSHYGVPTIS